MFRQGSSSFSPAVHGRLPRRPLRITIQVIRPAAKTAMSQARTSCNVPGSASQKVEFLNYKELSFLLIADRQWMR